MKDVTELSAETFDQTRFFVVFLSLNLGGPVLSTAVASTDHHNTFIFLGGGILFGIFPLVFIKKIMFFFAKHVTITFFDDHFSLLFTTLKTNVKMAEKTFLYDDILSCTIITSAQQTSSAISLTTANNGLVKYVFKNLRGKDDNRNISEMIYMNIKYRAPEIVLKPAFFGSDNGKKFLIGMGILLSVLLLLHIFYAPKTAPFTFMISLSFYLTSLAQRRKDIERVKRLSDG